MSTSNARPPSRVAAVVVDYDAGPFLADCICSLQDDGASQLVVVENGDLEFARTNLAAQGRSDVIVVGTGRNIGYGAGANRGVATLEESDYVLVCNPDLVVHPGALDALVVALDTHPTWAVVGPRVLTPDSKPYPSARLFPSPWVAAGHALLGPLLPDNPFTRRYRTLHLQDHPSEVDWVSGACFLARRRALEDVGGFDEAYFMFAEDMDLCWRLHRCGWRVGFDPSAVVTHQEGVSRRRHPYRMALAHHRSALRFARRSTSGIARVLLPVAALGLSARLVATWASTALRRVGARGSLE